MFWKKKNRQNDKIENSWNIEITKKNWHKKRWLEQWFVRLVFPSGIQYPQPPGFQHSYLKTCINANFSRHKNNVLSCYWPGAKLMKKKNIHTQRHEHIDFAEVSLCWNESGWLFRSMLNFSLISTPKMRLI